MKKRIVSILLVAAMVAGLAAGCGSKKEEKKEDGVTTVTWMTWFLVGTKIHRYKV